MKCVLKYPKKENTKRPEPTNNFDSGAHSINSILLFHCTISGKDSKLHLVFVGKCACQRFSPG